MSAELNAVLAQMAEINKAIQAKGANPNWDEIQKAFKPQLDALVAAQVAEAMQKQPAFRQPGAPIGMDGALNGNRYGRMAKSWSKDGLHKEAGIAYRPVDLLLAQKILEGQHKNYSPAMGGAAAALPSDDLVNAVKALSSTGSGTGDELVPTNMASQLWEDFFIASRIAANLSRLNPTSNPFDIPLGLGAVTWRKGAENTATTASDPATAKSTLTATEIVTEQNWSYTLDEDAAVAMAPALRVRLGQSGAEAMDNFALNADATDAATGNINLDDADPAATELYLSNGQDGIRHLWLVDNTGQGTSAGGDALGIADVTAALSDLGKYAADYSRLMIVCDIKTYLKGFLGLTEVITVDKFGPQATVLTGQLGSIFNIPIVVSASAPLTEADGKVSTTAGNNTLGQFSVLHRDMWYAGFWRNLMIETDRDIQKRQYLMVSSFRMGVAAHGTRSSATHTSGIYNILV